MPTLAITPPSGNANASTSSVSVEVEAAAAVPSVQVAFRQKVEREIRRYGVEQAMGRWRVVCDYMQTEDWWPAVARDVEAVFDQAYDERNRQQAELANRQAISPIQVSISQQQGNMGAANQFNKDSKSQVFNGDVTGQFME